MTLKVMEISAFRAGEKPYKKTDAKGLYLEVFPNGSKLWRAKYRMAGKEKRLALGAWPDVSLAKDFENTIASATAWLFMASVQLLARRIARL